ncbi:MAG: CDP-alcohol phosphatidyltransferase family protein [Eubacteriales bacterium]|jgi:CDP-diacylglycerol--serine O-phosphatidyltransferase
MIIGKWNKSVILTYIGVVFSITGIYLVVKRYTQYAMGCLILAGICDLFDGQIARRISRTDEEKLFGIELDSMADVINFIAFPCVILYMEMSFSFISIFLSSFFAICGIARLSFFNMKAKEDYEGGTSFFRGLPVTYTALILPFAYLLRYVLQDYIFQLIFAAVYSGIALFEIIDVQIPKPKGAAYPFFALLAISILWVYWGIL